MRHSLRLVACAAMLIATPALAEQWDFLLTNGTGKNIKAIAVAPTGTTDWQPWQPDPLARIDTLRPGDKFSFRFDRGASCRYDLRATFADATSAVWKAINLCDNGYVTVSLRDGRPTFFAN